MTEITTLTYRGKKFRIFKDGKFYVAIPSEYIKHGRLTRDMNGIQMCANMCLDGCLNTVMAREDVEYYVSQGMDRTEAAIKAAEELAVKFSTTVDIG